MLSLIVFFIGITEFHLSTQRPMSLDELLVGRNYSKDIPPIITDGVPVTITTQLLILKIYAIDAHLLSYKISYIVKQMWVDKRLARNDSSDEEVLHQDDAKNLIWLPNLDIINSDHTSILKGTTLTRINYKGEIYHSERLVSVCTCHMDLGNFPFDTQICPFLMEPYAYPAKDVNLTWFEDPFETDPMLLKPTGFVLKKVETVAVTKTYIIGGIKTNWSRLEVHFTLERVTLHIVYRTFLPTILVIIFSFGSYWIPDSALPARCTLIVTTFLTGTFILQNASKLTEASDKSTALQTFITTSIAVICLAIVQYIVILQLRSKKKVRIARNDHASCRRDIKLDDLNHGKVAPMKAGEESNTKNISRLKIELHEVHILDKVFRILVPAVYFCFCCIYFGYYNNP